MKLSNRYKIIIILLSVLSVILLYTYTQLPLNQEAKLSKQILAHVAAQKNTSPNQLEVKSQFWRTYQELDETYWFLKIEGFDTFGINPENGQIATFEEVFDRDYEIKKQKAGKMEMELYEYLQTADSDERVPIQIVFNSLDSKAMKTLLTDVYPEYKDVDLFTIDGEAEVKLNQLRKAVNTVNVAPKCEWR